MKSKIHQKYQSWRQGVTAITTYLGNSDQFKILVEQNRNLGDTLHLTPIMRHYRNLYPNARIAFMTAENYSNAHEFNPHFDAMFLVPSLNPQERIKLRKELLNHKGIDLMIAPSIFPYSAVWKELAWSHSNIADQYFHNAGIKDLTPNGGRKLVVPITSQDKTFADKLIKKHNLNPAKTCALEYNSYSAPPKWNTAQFAKFAKEMKNNGYSCISIAGKKEKAISGTIPALGITWRQTVALLDRIGGFVGSGSGITMLAAAAEHPPKIFEVSIPGSVSMAGCRYAPSITLQQSNPKASAKLVAKNMR